MFRPHVADGGYMDDTDPGRRMVIPPGAPDEASFSRREAFRGTAPSLLCLPDAIDPDGNPICKICRGDFEQMISSYIERECQAQVGIEAAVTRALKNYEEDIKESELINRDEGRLVRASDRLVMPRYSRNDIGWHATHCMQHDSVVAAINKGIQLVLRAGLAAAASKGQRAGNGTQDPDLSVIMHLNKTMESLIHAQRAVAPAAGRGRVPRITDRV